MKKRFMAFLLAAAMTAALVGCGGNGAARAIGADTNGGFFNDIYLRPDRDITPLSHYIKELDY